MSKVFQKIADIYNRKTNKRVETSPLPSFFDKLSVLKLIIKLKAGAKGEEKATKGTKDMAESFNLNNFLNTYKTQTYDPTKLHANAEANMEASELQKAEEAVKEGNFLALTLSEKLAELGIGERVMRQVANTAIGMFTDVINPLTEYLDKYENIFDQNVYNAEIQSYAKQMFFAGRAMEQEAAESTTGQKFVYDM